MAKKPAAVKEQPVTERQAKVAALKMKYPTITAVRKPVLPVGPEDCLRSPSMQMCLLTNEGGFRPGSCVEYYGLEGTLKTWHSLEMCREAQFRDPTKAVAYFDPEHAVDLHIAASKIGVDLGTFPDGMPKFDLVPGEGEDEPTLEDYLNRMYDYAASGLYSFIVLDSIAACMSNWESEQTDITNAKWGGPSIPMSKGLKRIKTVCAKTGTRVWYVNQLRTTTVQGPHGPISKDEPGGGKAVRYAATHRYKVAWANKDSEYAMLRVTAEKNKYGPPWVKVEVPILMGHGVDKEADLLMCAAQHGVVKKSGSWYYTLDGEAIGNGLQNAASKLRDKPDLISEITAATLKAGLPKEPLPTPLIDTNE